MLKVKSKRCKDCGYMKPLWSKGRCKSCHMRFKASNKPHKPLSPSRHTNTPLKPKSPSQTLKRVSEKRKEEQIEYKKICDEMDLVKPWICFFCNKEIKAKKPDHHHIDGRDENYLNRELLKHAHRKCHATYHDVSIHKWPWREGYLRRLRALSEELYQREILKLEK